MKMLTEKNSKRLLWLGLGLFIAGIILFLWNESLSQKNDLNSEKVAQFGDFIGGIIGSIWSLAGVILFYVALTEQRQDIKINRKTLEAQVEALNQQIKEFELQREELGETRKVFKEQSETLKIQRFENTLFQLINLHHEIIDKLQVDNTFMDLTETFEKRTVISKSIEFINQELRYINGIKSISDNGTIIYDKNPPKDIEDAEIKLIEAYNNFYFNRTKQILSHYYRNVYHIFKFIYKTELLDGDKKQFYASLVRAQLSSDELQLIAYNSLVQNLGYPNFLFLIKEFDLLQNFDFDLIFKYEHHREIFNLKIAEVVPEFKLNDE
tara:strand:+ start:1704 stop:2675 length:972 start_codon:yes stop_codon:yes gene_type:complete